MVITDDSSGGMPDNEIGLLDNEIGIPDSEIGVPMVLFWLGSALFCLPCLLLSAWFEWSRMGWFCFAFLWVFLHVGWIRLAVLLAFMVIYGLGMPCLAVVWSGCLVLGSFIHFILLTLSLETEEGLEDWQAYA